MTDIAAAVAAVRQLQNKLVLIVGSEPAARKKLDDYADSHSTAVVAVGAQLAAQLQLIPKQRRTFETARIFRDLISAKAKDGVCLCADIEILFDASLAIDPVLLLRQSARRETIVAHWPGTLQNGRLQYAPVGHNEYKNLEPIGVQIVEAV